jgi:hypothetical protein
VERDKSRYASQPCGKVPFRIERVETPVRSQKGLLCQIKYDINVSDGTGDVASNHSFVEPHKFAKCVLVVLFCPGYDASQIH